MMPQSEVWWDLVTAVGRMRWLQSKAATAVSTEEMVELERKEVEVDQLLDAILAETGLEVVYPNIIEPEDPQHN